MTDAHLIETDDFIRRHALPPNFRKTISQHYGPLVRWLVDRARGRDDFLLGISGAQGSGKSTLAEYLGLALPTERGTVAVLSLDDFYLTRPERRALARQVHPLLETRGVPGTHDIPLLRRQLDALQALSAGETLLVPRFDKATDDRAPKDAWTRIAGPVSMIVLEGWCVGARPQAEHELARAINVLEREEDPGGTWRRFVNESLRGRYATLNARLDALLYLQVPDFERVFSWRLEQERKLAARAAGTRVMSEAELARFILHYERLTLANQRMLPRVADIVMRLDDDHEFVGTDFNG
ncbi:MAG: hypothetical protein AAF417_02620 [Pseudomonadota bacterium]